MSLPPGFESTQQVLEALEADGAKILVTMHHGLKILCEERRTLKAMGLLRRRGRERAEIKARLSSLPRWLMIDDENITKPYPFDQLDEIPEDATVWCTRHARPVVWREWSDLACHLSVFSAHPAMIAWQVWLCAHYVPAVLRHGYYSPPTNHEPPPSKLLDALERREEARDVFNETVPGLGDWFADTE